MKRLFLAAASAATIVCAAAPASAATVIYSTGSNVVVTYQPTTGTFDGDFRFRVVNTVAGAANGLFTASFTFLSPIVGEASAIASNIIVRGNLGSDIDFTSAFINGSAGSVSNLGAASSAYVIDAPITTGLNTLTLSGRLNPNGNGVGNGLVTGSLTLVAAAMVPEPATWALLILGFGVVGAGLRRRTSVVQNARYTLSYR